jgi:UDP-N-acetylmuramoylalanine--D-glutamate ligase
MRDFFTNKTILILGFGLEGRSTFELLQDIPCTVIVADKNPEAVRDLTCRTFTGESYLDALRDSEIDIIMKSPGISFKGLEIPEAVKQKITSQTDLLLRFVQSPIIGITGTKGKSTVSSLIHHILNYCGINAKLIGNIGVPPLEGLRADTQTILVCEMSCHQLEYVQASPNVAVLLNIYEEHLDHYNSFADYRAAKENIYLYQKSGDLLIYNDELTSQKLLSSEGEKLAVSYDDKRANVKTHLPGEHNQFNIAVALKACLRFGCDEEKAVKAVESFTGLPHRLEFVGVVNGAKYVNDSISTIPRSAISAVLAYPDTDTLIIGGMDRGINYSELIDFLFNCGIINLVALPDSGHKAAEMLAGSGLNVYRAADMEDAVAHAVKVTKKRCILSPAAASYGFYKNFEERGEHFKGLVGRAETGGLKCYSTT